jgi:hypothetical protein
VTIADSGEARADNSALITLPTWRALFLRRFFACLVQSKATKQASLQSEISDAAEQKVKKGADQTKFASFKTAEGRKDKRSSKNASPDERKCCSPKSTFEQKHNRGYVSRENVPDVGK